MMWRVISKPKANNYWKIFYSPVDNDFKLCHNIITATGLMPNTTENDHDLPEPNQI
jgi:hypothetical protein